MKVPLFLLNTVLFPGAEVALHVFEERYRQMMSYCLEHERPFGVVLIKEGLEVGGLATPHAVGTLAQISSFYKLDDGRMYLTARGLHRFRIQYVGGSTPYPMGSVTQIPEESAEAPQQLAAQLVALYERYRGAICAATGSRGELGDLPAEPLAMSYILADRMRVPLLSKQRWLEADLATRLREICSAIQHELRILPAGPQSGAERGSGLN
jgi:Lon protease-like protein